MQLKKIPKIKKTALKTATTIIEIIGEAKWEMKKLRDRLLRRQIEET